MSKKSTILLAIYQFIILVGSIVSGYLSPNPKMAILNSVMFSIGFGLVYYILIKAFEAILEIWKEKRK